MDPRGWVVVKGTDGPPLSEAPGKRKKGSTSSGRISVLVSSGRIETGFGKSEGGVESIGNLGAVDSEEGVCPTVEVFEVSALFCADSGVLTGSLSGGCSGNTGSGGRVCSLKSKRSGAGPIMAR